MVTTSFLCLLAYLIGSIPSGYLLVRATRRLDVRDYGSHNVGAWRANQRGSTGSVANLPGSRPKSQAGKKTTWRMAAVVVTILALGGLGLLTSGCPRQQEAAPSLDVEGDMEEAALSESLTICAAQTELRLYSGAEEFQVHMSQRVAAAAGTGAQLVVLPEDIGAPLAMIAGYSDVKTAATLVQAIGILVHKHAAQLEQFLTAGVSPARALLLACAPQMHEVYTTTFSRLAAEHHVWIAAGSIPLPEVSLGDAQDVFNLAFLFAPDGHIAGFIPKVNLIELEQAAALDLTPRVGWMRSIRCPRPWACWGCSSVRMPGTQR